LIDSPIVFPAGLLRLIRSNGVQLQADLPDLYVNVDLHTGKETALLTAMERLRADWTRGGREWSPWYHVASPADERVFLFPAEATGYDPPITGRGRFLYLS